MSKQYPPKLDALEVYVEAVTDHIYSMSDEEILDEVRNLHGNPLELANRARELANRAFVESKRFAVVTDSQSAPGADRIFPNLGLQSNADKNASRTSLRRPPVKMSAAAAENAELVFEADFEAKFEKILDEYETLTSRDGLVTFLDDGATVCVKIVSNSDSDVQQPLTILAFGFDGVHEYAIHPSEQYEGLLEVQRLSPDDMETLVEQCLLSPDTFPVTWR